MTKLSYLEDSYRFEDNATVIAVEDYENGQKAVILDQTIFYPQGGGQPYDTGRIENERGVFDVKEVRFKDGNVYHIGHFARGEFKPGDSVKLSIDRERRMLHSRLHSAGHLIDVALRNIGRELKPGKGCHYPEGAYVEYEGDIAENEREALRVRLEQETARLIQGGFDVKADFVDRSRLEEFCYVVFEGIPADKPTRVVTVYGELGIPCGGTHVKNIKEIGRLKIPKIKAKSGTIRVSYSVD